MTLARRVIPILELDGSGAVAGGFRRGGLEVPHFQAVALFHAQDGADEVWVRLKEPDRRGAGGLFEPLRALRERLFVPLVAWGAVRSVADARLLIGLGADRVVVECMEESPDDPVGFVGDIVRAIGPDRVSVALVTRRIAAGGRLAWELCRSGGEGTGQDAVATALALERAGAGELVLVPFYHGVSAPEFVVHDGDLVDTLASALPVPVLSVGKDKEPLHMAPPLLMGADGVASARLFRGGNVTVAEAKAALRGMGIPLRPPVAPYALAG